MGINSKAVVRGHYQPCLLNGTGFHVIQSRVLIRYWRIADTA